MANPRYCGTLSSEMDSYDEYADLVERLIELQSHLAVAVCCALMVCPAIDSCSSDVGHHMEVLLKVQKGSPFRTLGDQYVQRPATVLGGCSLARWDSQHLLASCWPSLMTA